MELLRSVLVLPQGRQASRSYQNASNNGKAMHDTAEQDNASHGWAGYVKAQSMLGRLMLAIIRGN
jgi:hypothetical protein